MRFKSNLTGPVCAWAFSMLLSTWIVFLPDCVQAGRGITVEQRTERRSSIHEVDGYAYLSEEMTLAQTRQAALTNAKRQAVEMAKTRGLCRQRSAGAR